MKTDDSRTLLERFLQQACRDPEGESVQALIGSVIDSCSLKSPAEYLLFFRGLSQTLEDFSMEVEDFIASGEIARYAGTIRGRSKASKRITWRVAGVVRMRGGLVVGGTHYADFLPLLRQVGSIPDESFQTDSNTQDNLVCPAVLPVRVNLRKVLELCDASRLGAVISTQTDQILEANQTFARLLASAGSKLRYFQDYLLGNDWPRERLLFQELVQGARANYSQRLGFGREGAVVWLSVSAISIEDDDGGFLILRTLKEASVGREAVEFFEQERHSFSRELHDTVAQDAAALWMLLQSGKAEAPKIQELLSRLKQDLADLRANVREPNFDIPDLSEALEGLKHSCLLEFGLEVELVVSAVPAVSKAIGRAAFRVIQEALRNVASHAGVCKAAVTLQRVGGKLLGEVKDEGQGFELGLGSQTNERFGIIGMRERCKELGGDLTLVSSPGAGTSVHFEFPGDELYS